MAESKTYPKIVRSRREKAIFFPDKIEKVQKEHEGVIEIFYRYDTVKLPDKNQQIEDYNLFRKENYAELRKHRYGSLEKQAEIMQEQGFDAWQARCEQIKIELPK